MKTCSLSDALFRKDEDDDDDVKQWDMEGINDLLGRRKELQIILTEKIGQVLQIATLTPRKSLHNKNENQPEKIIVGNTHLYYHPKADHIRAIQAYIACKEIDKCRRRDGAVPYPFIFGGDLNSDPLSGAAQLLLTRSLLPTHHDCWKYLEEFTYQDDHGGNDDEPRPTKNNSVEIDKCSADLPSLHLPPSFPHMLSGCGIPKFTNFASGFVETLDYILCSKVSQTEFFGFERNDSVPMPVAEDILKYSPALPNECMPSDHVSIVCDLDWKIYDHASTC